MGNGFEILRNAAARAARGLVDPMSPSTSHSATSHSADELFAHAGWVRMLALQLVRDAAAADDLVQDVFVAALVQKPRADRNLEPWLRSVVRRRASFLARGRIRRSNREFAKSSTSEEGGAIPTDELLQRGEKHRQLTNAVMALRDPYRSVLLLRYFEDLTPAQIAERNGIPAATVRSQLKRGLDGLREELDEETGEERRAWCLALVPLAVDETSKGTLALSTLLIPLIAMQVLVKLALPLSAIALGVFLVQNYSTNAAEPERVESPPPAEFAALRSVNSEPGPRNEIQPGSQTEQLINPSRREEIAPVVASAIETSSMKGLIVDEATKKPVFDFALDLYSEGEKLERMTSDALGQFESIGEYAAGDYEYEVVDRDGVSLDWWFWGLGGSRMYRYPVKGELSFDPDESVLVSVELGPTYPLLIVGPGVALSAEYTAWLSGASAHSGRDNGLITSTPLRQARHNWELPWVRFQPAESNLSSKDGPWRLFLKSSDGLWSGEAEVDPANGDHGDPVELKLMSTTSFSVLLSGSNGAKLQKPIVYLAPSDGGDKLPVPRDADGITDKFARKHLLPGSYTLTVRADNAHPYVEEFSFSGGESISHSIELDSRSTGMYVHGELVSQSGSYKGEATVLLRGLDGDAMHSFMPKWEMRDGLWYAPLVFDELPSARYQLTVHNWSDSRRWSGAPFVIDGSVDDLVLTCLDQVSLCDLEFVVEISPDKEPPGYVELAYRFDGIQEGTSRKAYGGVFEMSGIPTDAAFEWCVRADGFTPVWGDLSDFREGSLVSDVHIELSCGWGARIRVVTVETIDRVPLSSARVFGDGVLLGITDENGELELRLDAEPVSLELQHSSLPSLTMLGGDFDRETGRLIGEPVVHEIEVGTRAQSMALLHTRNR